MADEKQVAHTKEEHFLVVEAKETNTVVIEQDGAVTVVIDDPSVVSEQLESRVIVEEKDLVVITMGQQGPPGAGGAVIDDTQASVNTVYSSAYIAELLSPWTLSGLSISPSSAVLGQTVAAVTLSWSTNYQPNTLSLNNGIGSITPNLTSYQHTGQTITGPVSYTLTAVRNGVTKTASASISFSNKVYYGVYPTQTTDDDIIRLMTGVVSNSRARSMTFNCSGGRFFHYAYPARLGDAAFQINNLTYTDVTKTVVPFTNEYGYTENYNVYYCNVIQNGAAITLVAS